MEATVCLRSARPEDAGALRDIYAPYVAETAVSLEWEAPSVEAFRARVENTLKTHPYLVAEKGGEILGYAYAGRFHPRAAFLYCAEVSIYLRSDQRRNGLGRMLYAALEERLRAMGLKTLYASIATTQREDDPYLTADSLRFHQKMGYHTVAVFPQCGWKFGRWYDLTWMEKRIGE